MGLATLPHGTHCKVAKCRHDYMASIEKEHNQKIACLKGQWYVVEKKWQRFKKIREIDFESEMNCTIGCPMPVTDLKYWQPHPALSKPAGEKILRFEVDGVAYQPPYSKALAACNCGAPLKSYSRSMPVPMKNKTTTSFIPEFSTRHVLSTTNSILSSG